MPFVVIFTDADTADPNLRSRHMRDHLAFLEANASAIQAAGPLTDPGGAGRDGLWIVAAESTEAVEALIKEDPFWPTGLRAGYAIIPWRQVYANGRRLIDPPA